MPEIYWSSREEGIQGLEAFFEYAGYKVRDMREPLQDTADYIQSTILFQFESEGAYRSGGWTPLEERYQAWKEAKGGGDMILQLEPFLLHSDPGTPEDNKMMVPLLDPSAWDITLLEAVYEPDSTRAGWHQTGVDYRRRGGALPARPILDLDEEDYLFIEGVFEDWLDELRSNNASRIGPATLPPIFS